MIGFVLAASVILSPCVYAQAQEKTPNVDDRVARMATELNLTESQADAVKPIIKEYLAKSDALLQETQWEAIVDHTALKRAMRALKQEESQELSKILSKDQLERWIQKENLRASLNQGGGASQVEDDVGLTLSGASFKFWLRYPHMV